MINFNVSISSTTLIFTSSIVNISWLSSKEYLRDCPPLKLGHRP